MNKNYANKDYNDKDILHIKNGDLEYLQFKKLNDFNIKHAITLKHGGVSSGIYSSLNFRINSDDKKENVFTNYKIIAKALNLKDEKIYKAKQNHTDNILVLNENNKNKYYFLNENNEEYDAYITNQKDIPILVTTADCNPVIVYDSKKKVIANIHSGWKGTLKKITLKVCKKMIDEFGCKKNNLNVFIGPSIRKCCFSSEDEEFKKLFTNVFENEDDFITYEKDSKRFHIDLIYLIRHDLEKYGIKNICVSDICTVCNFKDFYSYRKNTINKEKDYGLFATIVTL